MSSEKLKGDLKREVSFISDNTDYHEFGNPMVAEMYEFLTDPTSSRASYVWAILTSIISVFRVLAICFESVDGPNQYANRDVDRSRFPFLLTQDQYWNVYIAMMIPLILDTVFRSITFCFVVFGEENIFIYKELKKDKLELFLFLSDILGILPFFITAVYFRPYDVEISQADLVVITILNLMVTGRILRVIKDIPAIRAIRLALANSYLFLILPIFFFFMFNITAGVLLYFIEPCYNVDDCPWQDLFESTYFSIVTMTTTGYGNQIPQFEPGRFIACCIMLFGTLFLSMPLAIIGNEYDKAWYDISEKHRDEEDSDVDNDENDARSLNNGSTSVGEENGSRKKLSFFDRKGETIAVLPSVMEGPDDDGDASSDNTSQPGEKNEIKSRATSISAPTISSNSLLNDIYPLIEVRETLLKTIRQSKQEIKKYQQLNPLILLRCCEIKGNLPTLILYVRQSLNFLKLQHRNSAVQKNALIPSTPNRRRLSAFGGLAALSNHHHQQQSPHHSPQKQVPESPTPVYSHSPQTHQQDTNDNGFRKSSNRQSTIGVLRRSNGWGLRNLRRSFGIRTSSDNDVIAPEPERAHPDQLEGGQTSRSPYQRRSLYDRVANVVGLKDMEKLQQRENSEQFMAQIDRVTRDPNSFKSKVWILLELPNSSTEARITQIVLILLILISIFTLYTQTMPALSLYGETTEICGKVVQAYCSDKTNNILDAGCFVHNVTGFVTDEKLNFQCSEDSCFGEGLNFGADMTNVTCSNDVSPPFRDSDALVNAYGLPDMFRTKEQMHRQSAICRRLECIDNSHEYTDAQTLWITAEFVINFLFSVEMVLRLVVAESFKIYIFDWSNFFDYLSVIPFYAELVNTLAFEKFSELDFSVVASSPEPIFLVYMRALKVFRFFKITRHFHETKVLSETATKVWRQILGMIALLVFLVFLFATLLYAVEAGTPCYVGDPGCHPPEDQLSGLRDGDYILLNKEGDISLFGNIFYGFWFSFVTLTSTGYGDIVPVTNAGQVMSIILMIAGTFYMAMPLTAAASTFSQVHENYYRSLREKKHSVQVVPLATAQTANGEDQLLQVGEESKNDQNQLIRDNKEENKEQDKTVNKRGSEGLDARMFLSMNNFLREVEVEVYRIESFFQQMEIQTAATLQQTQAERGSFKHPGSAGGARSRAVSEADSMMALDPREGFFGPRVRPGTEERVSETDDQQDDDDDFDLELELSSDESDVDDSWKLNFKPSPLLKQVIRINNSLEDLLQKAERDLILLANGTRRKSSVIFRKSSYSSK